MNRNPGYRHMLLGAAALFSLSAVLPLACAEPEADLTAAGGTSAEAGPEGGKEAGPEAGKGGAAGKGGSNTGGASGKGGSSTGGSTGYGGYSGSTGTGGDTGSGGGGSGSGGASGGGGSAMYARPLGEGEQTCNAGQIFIFGSCFP